MVPKMFVVAGCCQLPVKHPPTSTSKTHPFRPSITRTVISASVVVIVAAAAVAADGYVVAWWGDTRSDRSWMTVVAAAWILDLAITVTYISS
jgi:hypothetical protein